MSWNYFFFIDESGDHSLQNINEDFPYFLLCGVLISAEEYKILEERIHNFKMKFFWTKKLILHSRNIRRCEDHFKILFDLKIKEKFYEEIDKIIAETEFVLISNAVKKIEYIKQYGKTAVNPYHISLSYMLERMIFCLNEQKANCVEIIAEKRGKKEDKQLLSHYNTIFDNGTYYVEAKRFQDKITKWDFQDKMHNDIGIQIADLCAYPLISYVRSRDDANPSYKILYPKIYRNPKTGNLSWLKIIP